MESLFIFLLIGLGVPWLISVVVGRLGKSPNLAFRTSRVISLSLSGLAVLTIVIAVGASPDSDPDRGQFLFIAGLMVGLLAGLSSLVTLFLFLGTKSKSEDSGTGLTRS